MKNILLVLALAATATAAQAGTLPKGAPYCNNESSFVTLVTAVQEGDREKMKGLFDARFCFKSQGITVDDAQDSAMGLGMVTFTFRGKTMVTMGSFIQ